MRMRGVCGVVSLGAFAFLASILFAQAAANSPVPNIPDLMRKVEDHQKQLEKVRENYTFTSAQTVEDIDSSGHVTKTETEEDDDFFVNGHLIERAVKKNGKPLTGHDEEKETERVTKLVGKAEKTPPDQPLEGQTISVSRLLDIMDVRNPRRESIRGRSSDCFRLYRPQRTRRRMGWRRTLQKNCRGPCGSTRPTARWRTSK